MKIEKVRVIVYVGNLGDVVQLYKDIFSLIVENQGEWRSELEFDNTVVALHCGGPITPKSSDLTIEYACRIIKEWRS